VTLRGLAACALLASLPALAARAQEPPPAPGEPPADERPWSASLAVAYLATGGNAETETLGVDLAAERRPLPWGFEVKASLHSAETDGATTAERSFASLRGKRALAPRWELFTGASAERDVFADLELRALLEQGVVYKALAGPRRTLDCELALTWTDEDRVAPEPDRQAFGALAAVDHEWKLSETATFAQRLTYHPNFDRSSDWRADLLVALEASLTHRLALKLSYEHHYRNAPIGDNEDADTVTKASLVWKL
jgi:putative salt-induced outer membrane protein YdiY